MPGRGLHQLRVENLRLASIHIQCPRIIDDTSVGICRLSVWLPDDETLLRVEGGVQALKPMIVEDDMMIGFETPSLTSLRCDMMKKVGALENAHRPSRTFKDDEKNEDAVKPPNSSENKQAFTDKVNASIKESSSSSKPDKSGLDAIHYSLALKSIRVKLTSTCFSFSLFRQMQ
jgi:hypothetical protein